MKSLWIVIIGIGALLCVGLVAQNDGKAPAAPAGPAAPATAGDKVELKTDCKVIGDIKAPRILIADGAVFKGNVDMDVKGGK